VVVARLEDGVELDIIGKCVGVSETKKKRFKKELSPRLLITIFNRLRTKQSIEQLKKKS